MTYKEVKYGLCNLWAGDYQPIDDSKDFCKYVFNHIGMNAGSVILFKYLSKKLSSPFNYLKGGGDCRMVFSQSQLIVYQVLIKSFIIF